MVFFMAYIASFKGVREDNPKPKPTPARDFPNRRADIETSLVLVSPFFWANDRALSPFVSV